MKDIFKKKVAHSSEDEDLDKLPSKDAKTVVVSLDRHSVEVDEKYFLSSLKKDLLSTNVKKEYVVATIDDNFAENIDSEELGELFDEFSDALKINVIIIKTIPSGVVKITENTKFKYEEKEVTEDDIPKDKVINVKNSPNIKGFCELLSIKDIVQLAEADNFINKFQGKDKVIYFCDRYYLEIKN